jgi:hypothetical protein
VHVRNGRCGVSLVHKKNVCGSAIGVDYDIRTRFKELKEVLRTLSVHRHVQISNWAICSKYFSEMVLIDVFGKLLDDDLERLDTAL